MLKEMTLTAAYGRTYADKESAMRDWYAGKDFKIVDGPYCSIRDLDTLAAYGMDINIMLTDDTYVLLYAAPEDKLAGII